MCQVKIFREILGLKHIESVKINKPVVKYHLIHDFLKVKCVSLAAKKPLFLGFPASQTMSDPLFPVKTAFFLGNYTVCIAEAAQASETAGFGFRDARRTRPSPSRAPSAHKPPRQVSLPLANREALNIERDVLVLRAHIGLQQCEFETRRREHDWV